MNEATEADCTAQTSTIPKWRSSTETNPLTLFDFTYSEAIADGKDAE